MHVTIGGARFELKDFVLRTPLLPFSELERLAVDAAGARERLRELAADPVLAEGLYLASPDLVQSLARGEWEGRPVSAVFRYVNRAAARPTPFGVFAGCSVGGVGGSKSRISLVPRRDYVRRTRLDSSVTAALERHVFAHRSKYSVSANTSLFLHRGRWRWVARRQVESTVTFDVVQAASSPEIDAVVSLAMKPLPIHELVTEAARVLDVGAEEAREFVGMLLEAQLLVSDAALMATGPDPLEELIGRCRDDESSRSVHHALTRTADGLRRLDGSFGNAAASYEATLDPIRPWMGDVAAGFQVDLFKPAGEAVLADGVGAAIASAAELLVKIAPPPADNYVGRLRDAFLTRYESAEVPLLEALDEEVGIDLDATGDAGATGLLDGINFPPYGDPFPRTDRDRTTLLFRLIERAQHAGDVEVQLTEADVAGLDVHESRPMGGSLAVVGALASEGVEGIAHGNFSFVVRGVVGAPGARLLGRFCDGSEEICRIVREQAEGEQNWYGDAIVAEVVHVPYGRTANLSHRPVLRQYEIPYLGRSGAPPERQIHPSDILVSVREGRFVLRSASLGREIIPRVTTAQNFFASSLRVHRFLAAIQADWPTGWLAWSWGVLVHAPFLPRLRYGRVIISKANWNFSGALIAETMKRGPDAIAAFRSKYRLPRHVSVGENDEELVIDLESPLAVAELVRFSAKRPVVTLAEVCPRPDQQLFVQSEEGTFVHEMIVPMARVGKRDPVNTYPAERTPARRSWPGGPWAYVKAYCTPPVADQLVVRARHELVADLLSSGAIDRWFFIRFNDPEWHLRLRFRLTGDSWSAVTTAFRDVFREECDAGAIWKVEWSTYEREIERYGGSAALEAVERLFMADSEAAVAVLEQLTEADRQDDRWLAALLGLDSMFDHCAFDLRRRNDVMQTYARSAAIDMAFAARDTQRVAERFRRERPRIQSLLAGASKDEVLLRTRATYDAHNRNAADAWRALREISGLPDPLVRSLLHMHMNRALPSAHRRHERIVYDYLARTYEAELAMRKQRSVTSVRANG